MDGLLRIFGIGKSLNPVLEATLSFPFEKEEIQQIEISPDSKWIISITKTSCCIWNQTSNKPITSIRPQNPKFFKGVCFSPSGNILYIGSIIPGKKSWIEKYSFDNGKISLLKSNIAHGKYHHNALKISPNGKYLATGTSENGVAIFRADNLKHLYEVQQHEFFVTNVVFSADNKYLISVGADYSLYSTKVPEIEESFLGQHKLYILYFVIALILIYFMFVR